MSDDKKKIVFGTAEILNEEHNEAIMKSYSANTQMIDLIAKAKGSATGKRIPRLAFTENPTAKDVYAGIYKNKSNLMPDSVIKQIRVQNLLVAAILRARSNIMSMMGHLRKDRFDLGIEIKIKSEFKDFLDYEQTMKVQERIDKFSKLLVNCGYTDGLKENEKLIFSDFLGVQAYEGVSFGRFGTEIVYNDDGKFHRFRPIDIGTIYKATKKGESAAQVRASSLKLLQELSGENIKLSAEKFEQDEYAWVQVIDGQPRQAFGPNELLVCNINPSIDVELNGYPVSALDTLTSSLSIFISIETYNRLYFQNGRGAKGMVVIKSDEIDQSTLDDIKQQFNASINNVSNSFRTPIFGVSKEDDVNWVSTVATSKDGEFQFLHDQVARNICAGFAISPEELPGFAHLGKGTNQNSLSESNNEYKLEAGRDVGIRPLILKFQDFLNEQLLPIIDAELSQLCYISIGGLDAESKQQEANRLQVEAPIHYDYDAIMEEVSKSQIGAHMGGKIPFNAQIRAIMDSYIPVSEITGELLDCPALFFDPALQYMRDAFFYQNMQLLAQFNSNAVKAFYATRADSYDLLVQFLQDYLDIEEDK